MNYCCIKYEETFESSVFAQSAVTFLTDQLFSFFPLPLVDFFEVFFFFFNKK